MLAFEGNTAPYLINAYVRIQAIFRRREQLTPNASNPNRTSAYSLADAAERALGIELLRFGEVIEITMEDYAPHKLCHYLFDLAGLFHHFYEHCPILKSTPEQQLSRLALCALTARVLKKGMQLLGINTLEKM